MRFERKMLVAVALAAGLSVASLGNVAAQDTHAHNWGTSDNPAAQAHIEKGDEFLGAQDYGQARAHYEQAVEIVRQKADFPGPALYRIAASYYYEGKSQTAANHFDQLANEAAQFGDVVTQIWALADAAWIYGQAGNSFGVEQRVQRVNKLLKSPFIPEDEKRMITSKRLGEITTLVEESTR
jgi:tetratricopeptide (TPR) repeat protein